MSDQKKHGLGRGLSALLGEAPRPASASPESRADGVGYLGRRGALMKALLWNDQAAHFGCRIAHVSSGAWTPLAQRRWPLIPAAVFRSAFAHDEAGHGGVLNAVVFGGLVGGLAFEVTQPVSVLHGALDRAAPIAAVQELSAQHGWPVEVVDGASHQVVAEESALVAEWLSHAVLGLPGAR